MKEIAGFSRHRAPGVQKKGAGHVQRDLGLCWGIFPTHTNESTVILGQKGSGWMNWFGGKATGNPDFESTAALLNPVTWAVPACLAPSLPAPAPAPRLRVIGRAGDEMPGEAGLRGARVQAPSFWSWLSLPCVSCFLCLSPPPSHRDSFLSFHAKFSIVKSPLPNGEQARSRPMGSPPNAAPSPLRPSRVISALFHFYGCCLRA